jgi:hypothetical protein
MPTLTRKKPSKKISRKPVARKRSAPKPVAKPLDLGCGSLGKPVAESSGGGGCGAHSCGG